MRPSLDEVVKRKKQTHSVEASAMVFTQQGKPSERRVSRMDKPNITNIILVITLVVIIIILIS